MKLPYFFQKKRTLIARIEQLETEAKTYRKTIGGHKSHNTRMKNELAEYIVTHQSLDEIDEILSKNQGHVDDTAIDRAEYTIGRKGEV